MSAGGTAGLADSVDLVALVTGLFSFCPLYAVLGVNTCGLKKQVR